MQTILYVYTIPSIPKYCTVYTYSTCCGAKQDCISKPATSSPARPQISALGWCSLVHATNQEFPLIQTQCGSCYEGYLIELLLY